MSHLLALASGKGGTGVTSIAIALGASLSRIGVDTTLVDANITTPNVGLYLGTPNVPVALQEVLNDPRNLEDAMYHHAPSGLKIIPSRLGQNTKHHEILKLQQALLELPSSLAIIDCASGAQSETLAALAVADSAVLVTTPELPAVIDTLKLVKKCRHYGTPVRGIVVNRTGQHDHELSIENIQSLLETPVIANIPNDAFVSQANAATNPFTHADPESPASRAVQDLANVLLS